MTADTIRPGQWVRWIPCSEDAPLAGWRQLASIDESGFRWMKVLTFTDGYQIPMHHSNLRLVDENSLQLWETSETAPAGVAS